VKWRIRADKRNSPPDCASHRTDEPLPLSS
jgi:hypothetical protein